MLYDDTRLNQENRRMSNPTSAPTLGAYNVEDLRRIAQRRLPKGVFEFVDRVPPPKPAFPLPTVKAIPASPPLPP